MQLAHAGRKRVGRGVQRATLDPEHGGWSPLFAPSHSVCAGYQTPVAMSTADIAAWWRIFAPLAKGRSSGIRVLELHALTGICCTSFFSPLSNTRDDDYGAASRTVFVSCWKPSTPCAASGPTSSRSSFAVSATDWAEGGWHLDECVELSRIAGERGVDLVDCSTGETCRAYGSHRARLSGPFSERSSASRRADGACGRATSPLNACRCNCFAM